MIVGNADGAKVLVGETDCDGLCVVGAGVGARVEGIGVGARLVGFAVGRDVGARVGCDELLLT